MNTAEKLEARFAPEPPARSPVPTLRRGLFALFDQGLFTAANFILNILLARWLEPRSYGVFAVGFSIFLLAGAAYIAVLGEPLLVFGAARYSDRQRAYFKATLKLHALITGIAAAGLVITALAFLIGGQTEVAKLIVVVGLASPFILLTWFGRDACYALDLTGQAARAGALHLVVLLTALGLMHHYGSLTAVNAFVAMAVAGLVSGAWLLWILRQRSARGLPLAFRSVVSEHFSFGSWNLLATALWWASGQILFLMLPVFMGLEVVAAFAAIMNLARPINPLMRAICSLQIMDTARAIHTPSQRSRLAALTRRTVALSTASVLLYGIILTFLAQPVLRLLYHGRYDSYASPVFFLLLALAFAASAAQQTLGMVIKAAGNTRELAMVWLVPAIATVVASIPVMLMRSLPGVILVFGGANVLGAIFSWREVRTIIAAQEPAAAAKAS
ncbi:MAG: lipopolysaccharide biosynthesis protein [Candidatus Binataceae bacterium]